MMIWGNMMFLCKDAEVLCLKTVAHSKKRCFDLMISSHEHSNLVGLLAALRSLSPTHSRGFKT
jgi:hypothetical protein